MDNLPISFYMTGTPSKARVPFAIIERMTMAAAGHALAGIVSKTSPI